MNEEGKFRGRLKSTGLRPKFVDKLEERGVFLDRGGLRARVAGRRLMTADAVLLGNPGRARRSRSGSPRPPRSCSGVMLFGTASRRRQQKIIGERMAAVGNRGRKVTHVQPDSTAGGWIPARVTNFGRRFADARGFSGRLDAELEAADVSLRSGEFVIVTVGAGVRGPVRRVTPSSGARGSRSASACSRASARRWC